MESLQDIITRVYERCGTTVTLAGDRWTATQVLKAINDEFRSLRRMVRDANPDLFLERLAGVSLTRDTAYALPAFCERLIDVEEASGSGAHSPLQRFSYDQDSKGRYIYDYEVIGRSIYLRNIDSLSVNIRYLRDLGDLHYGTCPGVEVDPTDTVIWLANAAANATGTIVKVPDYYNGLLVMIVSGTGDGQYRTVVDHDQSGGFYYLVTDSAWVTEPDETSVYCLLPPWGEQFNELLVLGAIGRAPVPGWQGIGLGSPHYAELKHELALWAARQRAGGQSANRDMNTMFGKWE